MRALRVVLRAYRSYGGWQQVPPPSLLFCSAPAAWSADTDSSSNLKEETLTRHRKSFTSIDEPN